MSDANDETLETALEHVMECDAEILERLGGTDPADGWCDERRK